LVIKSFQSYQESNSNINKESEQNHNQIMEDNQQTSNNKNLSVAELESINHKDFIELISNQLKETIKVCLFIFNTKFTKQKRFFIILIIV
jgi:hypothetical protein